MKTVTKNILVGTLIMGCATGIHYSQTRLDQDREIQFVDRSPVFLPDGKILKWLSLGYNSMVADWLWILGILYVGRRALDEHNPYYVVAIEKKYPGISEHLCHETQDGHHVHHHDKSVEEAMKMFQSGLNVDRSGVPVLPDSVFMLNHKIVQKLYEFPHRGLINYIGPLLDRIATVNPYFIEPYLFGGTFLSMELGQIDESISLLKRGYEYNPKRWEFPYYLSWIYWIYVGDYKQTYDYLIEANQIEGCPRFAGALLAGLSGRLNQNKFTEIFISSMLVHTSNPRITEQLTHILESMHDVDHLKD